MSEVKLVSMVRDALQYPEPHTASVPESEVENYRKGGFIIEGEAPVTPPGPQAAPAAPEGSGAPDTASQGGQGGAPAPQAGQTGNGGAPGAPPASGGW